MKWAVVGVVGVAALVVVSRALVLCPQFPSCCYPYDTCHMLCPSCKEARFFVRGVRKFPKFRRKKPCQSGTFLNPDPYAFPDVIPFPSPFICL